MAFILVVDDDKSIKECFKELFRNEHTVLGAYNEQEAFEIISNKNIDICFLDYKLPGKDGLKILKQIKHNYPNIYIILITGYGSFETIIEASSLGVYDYIEKPLNIEKVSLLTNRILDLKKMNYHIKLIEEKEVENFNFKNIIGHSLTMQNIFIQIGRIVNNNVNVLLKGESGTGKELIARAIHYNSERKNEPFVAINCSGISDTLLENELFGHEAQAYTGAVTKKIGKFEAANEGTILLDEIADTPLSIQAKLLRVLQEKEFYRLGSVYPIKLRARIITATNKNLNDLIIKGKFREDLFYRINVASIEIPPLRQRKEDIPYLIDYFISKSNKTLKKNIKGLSEKSLKAFCEYNWPGNIRELENVILNVCINLNNSIIGYDNIKKYLYPKFENENIFQSFVESFLNKYSDIKEEVLPYITKKIQIELINQIGLKFNYNKTSIANFLGVSRVTLNKIIKEK